MMADIWQGLLAYPAILLGIAVLLIAVVVFVVKQQARKKRLSGTPFLQSKGVAMKGPTESPIHMTALPTPKQSPSPLPPAAVSTPTAGTTPPLALALVIDVTESADATMVGYQVVVTQFPYLIGREGCPLSIRGDQRISRQHAQITQVNGRFYLTDLGSSNGTFVDNSPLAANQPYLLKEVEKICLGRATYLSLQQKPTERTGA